MSTRRIAQLSAMAALVAVASAEGYRCSAFHRPEHDKERRSASLEEELMRKAEEKRARKAAKRAKKG